MIFAYLDAETILLIHNSAKDIKWFDKSDSAGKDKGKCQLIV